MSKRKKRDTCPDKTTMNLYYKPDRTTKPATVALYVLFVLTLLAGFGKLFVYDLLLKLEETEEQLSRVQQECDACESRLKNYDEILRQYRMYSATEEEEGRTDRMEILQLLDEKVKPSASISSVSVTDGLVNVRFSGVTLGETADIIRELNTSPLVDGTTVNTAVAENKNTSRTERGSGSGTDQRPDRRVGSGTSPKKNKRENGKTDKAENTSVRKSGKQKTNGTYVTADIQISLQKENREEKPYEKTDQP